MKHYIIAVIAFFVFVLSSCGDTKFKVEGEIPGAEGKSVVLEKSDFGGRWVVLDSAKIDNSGKFAISSPAPASPEIYRISLGNNFIYFPIDSIENLNITTSASEFGHKYTITGTPQAEQMAQFEQELMSLQMADGEAVKDFKRTVYSKYLKESQGSILSYYVLTKVYNNKPLYNPEDLEDAKYFGAVATQFESYRPNDPHLQMLRETAMNAMKNKSRDRGLQTVISANEISAIEIELPDISGKKVKLTDIIGKGKPVAVVFSMMNEPESPAFNRELHKIYNSKRGSFEIYQISFDADHYGWRDAVANLPWINVIDPQGTTSSALIDYNVGQLPAIFLYNSKGELTDRLESLSDLNKKI